MKNKSYVLLSAMLCFSAVSVWPYSPYDGPSLEEIQDQVDEARDKKNPWRVVVKTLTAEFLAMADRVDGDSENPGLAEFLHSNITDQLERLTREVKRSVESSVWRLRYLHRKKCGDTFDQWELQRYADVQDESEELARFIRAVALLDKLAELCSAQEQIKFWHYLGKECYSLAQLDHTEEGLEKNTKLYAQARHLFERALGPECPSMMETDLEGRSWYSHKKTDELRDQQAYAAYRLGLFYLFAHGISLDSKKAQEYFLSTQSMASSLHNYSAVAAWFWRDMIPYYTTADVTQEVARAIAGSSRLLMQLPFYWGAARAALTLGGLLHVGLTAQGKDLENAALSYRWGYGNSARQGSSFESREYGLLAQVMTKLRHADALLQAAQESDEPEWLNDWKTKAFNLYRAVREQDDHPGAQAIAAYRLASNYSVLVGRCFEDTQEDSERKKRGLKDLAWRAYQQLLKRGGRPVGEQWEHGVLDEDLLRLVGAAMLYSGDYGGAPDHESAQRVIQEVAGSIDPVSRMEAAALMQRWNQQLS